MLALFCAAMPLQAQQLIHDLDRGYPEDQFYALTYSGDDEDKPVVLRSNGGGHDGKSVAMAWRIEVVAGGLGFAGFGYLHAISTTTDPFPDLTPFTHLSLWYNNVEPAAAAEKVTFRFELHEREAETDPSGERGGQVWIYQAEDVLTTPAGWTELLIPLVQADELGGDGFAIPPGGFQGDGVLDLDAIKHWYVLLLVEGEPAGSVLEGTTRFDYLTAQRLTLEGQPVAAAPEPDAPLADALHANYPNPFASATTLTYALRRPADVSLKVYDLLGREVAVLLEGRQPAGLHEVPFDAGHLATGTYVGVLDVGGRRFTRTMTRVR